MNDESIKQRISDLIDREHQLRRQAPDEASPRSGAVVEGYWQ